MSQESISICSNWMCKVVSVLLFFTAQEVFCIICARCSCVDCILSKGRYFEHYVDSFYNEGRLLHQTTVWQRIDMSLSFYARRRPFVFFSVDKRNTHCDSLLICQFRLNSNPDMRLGDVTTVNWTVSEVLWTVFFFFFFKFGLSEGCGWRVKLSFLSFYLNVIKINLFQNCRICLHSITGWSSA